MHCKYNTLDKLCVTIVIDGKRNVHKAGTMAILRDYSVHPLLIREANARNKPNERVNGAGRTAFDDASALRNASPTTISIKALERIEFAIREAIFFSSVGASATGSTFFQFATFYC